MRYRFAKSLYSKVALLKAAYNFTDRAFLHLDADENYFFIDLQMKVGYEDIDEKEILNEMLTQSVRHEVYLETKNIRELLLARAMSTSIVADTEQLLTEDAYEDEFSENEILKDWFSENEDS